MPIAERLLAAIRKTSAVLPALFLLLPVAASAQISLSTAVNLAEKSSPSVRIALADTQHAAAGVTESRDPYFPSVILGSSIGPPPYGFPLGNPDIYDINAQSLVLSFSQPDYIRAARSALRAAEFSLKDAELQVAADVSLDCVQLDHDLREIAALDEEQAYAEKLVSLEHDRVQAGVDPRVDQLQVELTAAKIDEKRIHLQNDADETRLRLAHLTGLPAEGLTIDSASIPPPPTFNPDAGSDQELATNNPALGAAQANAQSKLFMAFGDEKQRNRPLVAFGFRYQRFAKFQNFAEYYHNFQQNNISAGVQLTFPIFDPSRKAKARESAADAAHATAEADQTRNQIGEESEQMRRTILELAAQQHVAQLESELAQEQLKTVDAELTSGPGSATAQPVAPTTAQKAHIDEREKYEDLLDTNFSLMKVELNLLRMTGQIDDWVRSSLKPPVSAPVAGPLPPG